MTRRPTILLTFAVVCVAVSSAFACEIRVRDSAFRIVRDVHKLCVIAGASDESAKSIVQRLNQWLESTDGTFNLEVVRINADDPETNWQSIGIPSAPPKLPVTVLVGRDNGIGENFVIDHYQPAPTEDELSAIADSPARRRLASELAQNVAVLILAAANPTSDSSAADRISSIVEAGIADERIGLSMITVDRSDPAERLLCQFMGLRADSPDTLCVAFGRGKLMSPPLIGDQIDSANINKLITQIRQACSCSRPLPTMGVDIPLIWSDAIDATVILMDQELDLSELDTEVQNMLAAKVASNVDGEPTVVPIPLGKPAVSLTPTTPNPTTSIALSRLVAIVIGLAIVVVLAVVFAVSRRRSSEFDSAG